MIPFIRSIALAALLALASGATVAAELPSGGGEPGAALLSHFDAIRSGDAERIKSETHPDEHAQLDAIIAEGEFEMMIGMMQAFLPDNVVVTGGSVEGDDAEVNFNGDMDGEPTKGTAKLSRVDGRWLVHGVSLSN
jgi:hypothetical protein